MSPQAPPPAPGDGEDPRSSPPGGAGAPPGGANFLIALLIAIGLALFLWQMLFAGRGTAISYSRFKSELRKGNVEKVEAKGDLLWGTLHEEVEVKIPGRGTNTVKTKRWETTHPKFGDEKLIESIEALDTPVEIRVHPDNSGWIGLGLMSLLTVGMVLALWAFMARRARDEMGGFFNITRSKARTYDTESQTGITFDDVAGIESIKQDVHEIVDFLEQPEKYAKLGGTMPRGILLTGPPGTGKTLLARAVAGEAGVPFYSISGSEFIEMFVGVGASRVRDLFAQAKQSGRSIIFIDEIDAVGRTRGTGLGRAHDEREQTLNQMLSEMDGFEHDSGVVVMAATNRPDVLDPALLRPGRFDRQIVIPLPERHARLQILEIHSKNKPMADDVDLSEVARGTPGFSGADLENLLNEAAILAARNDHEATTRGDLEEARDKVMMGNQRPDLLRGEDERRRTAMHEAGHALLAVLLKHTDPLHKVTIIPRGRALGLTQLLPDEDRIGASKAYLLDMLTMLLAGRVAEELDDPDLIGAGSENDFERVHQFARRMVARWGMSDRIGPVAYNTEVEHPFLGLDVQHQRNYSEQTAWLIDTEVNAIVRWALDRCRAQVRANRNALQALTRALMIDETLDHQRVHELCSEASYVEVEPLSASGPFGIDAAPASSDSPAAG